jgi:DNA mismatch endonuclease (patch repair protein)
MADIFSKRRRSMLMSRVRGRGNKSTELRLIKLFRCNRIRGWRRGVRLTGKPDFVFPRSRVAIFVDGCFWHGCPAHGSTPRNNRSFWKHKLTQNAIRDRRTNRSLRSRGWRVMRIWQHELSRRNEQNIARRVQAAVTGAGA